MTCQFSHDLALIGCGYWGKNLARNFNELGALHTICDVDAASLEEVNPDYSLVRKVTQVQEVLNDATITKVAIAAPAAQHYRLAKLALEAGKDVFVEKPLCLEVREAEELVELSEKTGRILMVGHLLQYHPCVQKLRELVAQGELGKLYYITSNRLNLGKFRREENALWSFAPHDVSVILSLCGNQLPDQVRCMGEAYISRGVADTTLTKLRFSDGVGAHIYVSWLNPFKEQKLTVVGSHGMAVFDDTRPWQQKLVLHRDYITWTNGQVPTPKKAKCEAITASEAEPLKEECSNFLARCHDRLKPRTDGHEGLRVLTVLHAAHRSLNNDGRPVALERTSEQASDSRLPTLSGESRQFDYYVHPTAVVDEGAVIGKGTKIWHFCHVARGAQIGESCTLGQNVNVAGGSKIGNSVKIQNNVSIYNGVEIEDDVFLGPSCVLTNVTNPRSQINRHKLYEKTLIRRGATIGANATVICGVTIGTYAFVGAGAVVSKDVADYALVLGNPARQTGWMSRHGHVLRASPSDGVMICPETGYRYREIEPGLLRCLDLDEEAPLPQALSVGKQVYDDLKSKG